MTSSATSIPEQSVQAEGFSSMGGFLGANPAVKNLLEKSIMRGDVCTVNLSEVTLDTDWDAAPAEQKNTSAHKIK